MTAADNARRAIRRAQRQEQAIAEVLARLERRLRRTANVVGYAVGLKGARLAAVVYVTHKVPLAQLKPADRLPDHIEVSSRRVPTVVKPFPRLDLAADPAANRKPSRNPIVMGCQIGICHKELDDEYAWGTAGAVVYDAANPQQKYLLGAGHVMRLHSNDVIQPSTATEGAHNRTRKSFPDRKANIGSVIRIAPGGVDAGIAEIDFATPDIIGLTAPGPPEGPMVGLPVQKSGATTGVTAGRIGEKNAVVFKQLAEWMWDHVFEIFVGSPHTPGFRIPRRRDASLRGLFVITPTDFADKGDSGALIIVGPQKEIDDYVDSRFRRVYPSTRDALKHTLKSRAVGLLIGVRYPDGAVGQEITLALDALKVRLVT